MRKIYIRETEYIIIESVYEPTEEYPMLPPPEEKHGLSWRGWFLIGLLALLLAIFGPKIGISKAHAQKGICNFYNVCPYGGYGNGSPPSVYIPPPIIIVPSGPEYYPVNPCDEDCKDAKLRRLGGTPPPRPTGPMTNCTVDPVKGMSCK